MDKDTLYMQEVANSYREDVQKLVKYIPWLESKAGTVISNIYEDEGIAENSMVFPVYDSMLMGLVKDTKGTGILDRNYVYVYSRYRMKTVADEKKIIEQATINEMGALRGIFSKYIMGGMVKAVLWNEGVSNGCLLGVLLKMKEILEYWDKPIEG